LPQFLLQVVDLQLVMHTKLICFICIQATPFELLAQTSGTDSNK